tara:strand:+ start:9527 stop:10882 length:1356 start_codon:yes stop_codon:yes gene_type:complete
MSNDIRVRKGADLNIKGKAEKIINKNIISESYAIQPDDFFSLTPKLIVREGDYVSKGSPIFFDKNNPNIQFVSPVSGKINQILRGSKRKIESVIVKSDRKKEEIKHNIPLDSALNRKSIIDLLTKSGSWPFIRQRPYNIIADPKINPKLILISCFTSAPLDVDFDFLLKDNKEDFQKGVDILSKLSDGDIVLTIDSNFGGFFQHISNAKIVSFNGPHPTANPSVQIQKISPINPGQKIWTVRPEDVVNIGRFFTTGIFSAQRTIAVAGNALKKPQYFKSTIGVQIGPMIKITKLSIKTPVRYINGDVLSGSITSFDGHIGFYNNLVSVIPEGNNYRMFGWIPFVHNNIPSLSKTSLSWFFSKNGYDVNTNINGEERAMVVTGEMEKVFPLDIHPMQLLKVCMTGDIEKMEAFGIYEVVPEDFGLIDYSNTSKIEAQKIISNAIELMIKEVG